VIELLHVIETLGSGGAERLLHTNLTYLDRARFRSSVVALRAEGDHWRAPIEALGVAVENLGVRTRRDLPGATFRLRKLIARRGVTLLHTHLWEANVVGRLAGRLSGVPVISSIHNPDYEPAAWRAGRHGHGAKRLFFLALDRATARIGCTRMIAVSESVRTSGHAYLRFPLERIDVVENPIDLDELRRPPARDRNAILRELGLPADALLMLSVARLSPQKGLHHAIDALARILESHPRAHLLSVGALDHAVWFDALKRRSEERGVAAHVHFLGPRRDVADWLRACDVFVFPSLFEGLGLALIEAMAAGVACVASAVGPVTGIVRDGVDGLLVPAGDEVALAKALLKVIDDPPRRASLGRAAADAAARRFDPRSGARRLEEVYERVLAACGPSNHPDPA
jgi:glycosyltransferase involved in cell wall biosynthesis